MDQVVFDIDLSDGFVATLKGTAGLCFIAFVEVLDQKVRDSCHLPANSAFEHFVLRLHTLQYILPHLKLWTGFRDINKGRLDVVFRQI